MFRIILLGFALVGLTGCDSGPKTYLVTGTVYWNNELIGDGHINFLAEDGKSPPATGIIKDGKYEVRTTVGAKRIEVTNQRNKGYDKVMKQDIRTNDIPDEYNAKSTLRFEVEANDNNVYDLKLPMKK